MSGEGDKFGPRRNPVTIEQPSQEALNGLHAEAEAIADLTVRSAFGNEPQHV